MSEETCKRGHRREGSGICRPCRKESQQRWREENRERRRYTDRKRYAAKKGVGPMKMKQPPEPEWHRWLPAEPFTNWVNAKLEQIDQKQLADICGFTTRMVYALKHGERKNVSLDFVDRAFVRFAEHAALELIYPLEALRDTKNDWEGKVSKSERNAA